MSKRVFLTLLILVLVLATANLAHAQDRTPIALGEWVSGTITNDAPEVKYSFTGTKGQLIVVTMIESTETDLDSFVILRNLDGDIIGQNDDVPQHYSMVVAELPADGDYTVVATRLGGADNGDTTGDYHLMVTEYQTLDIGAKTTIKMETDEEKRYPHFFVLHPVEDTSVHFSFIGQSGDMYPDVGLFQWVNNDYPTILLQTYGISQLSSLTFAANLKSGNFYVLEIDPTSLRDAGEGATLGFTTE